MIDKMTLKLGSLGDDFQLINPDSMSKITGGATLSRPPSLISTCGGIMPS